MIAYADSSVLLRLVLGEPGRLAEWEEVDRLVTSRLAEVECLRTLDRLALRQLLDTAEVVAARSAVFELLDAAEVVELTRPVLSRAGQPFPAPLGTLDALHLATALLWREQEGAPLLLATHDAALALAARGCGLPVAGA